MASFNFAKTGWKSKITPPGFFKKTSFLAVVIAIYIATIILNLNLYASAYAFNIPASNSLSNGSKKQNYVIIKVGKSKKINTKDLARIFIANEKIAKIWKDPLSGGVFLVGLSIGVTEMTLQKHSFPIDDKINIIVQNASYKKQKQQKIKNSTQLSSNKTLEIPGWDND